MNLSSLTHSIRNFFTHIYDYILPKRRDTLVVETLTEEKIFELPRAPRCDDADWIGALFNYHDDRVRALVWELKYRGNTFPVEHIGTLMYEEIHAIVSDVLLFEHDARFVLIPIPITPERRHERGYNQSEYIARAIVASDIHHTLLYAPQWLEKTKETEKQSRTQSRSERLKNIIGSFRAHPHVENAYVILVDDVVTTGATLSEARRVLLEAGATDVYAFTIAH